MIQSPLNYTGGKYRLLPQILPLFPNEIETFVDLFCGGCNVGVNVKAEKYIYNDRSKPLIKLLQVMKRLGTEEFIKRVERVIAAYGLSDVKTHGYNFYNCNGSTGLGSYNKEPYLKLRTAVNEAARKNDDYYIKLYVLIVFSFNNQIRFNKNGAFNLPVGKRDFNKNMCKKLHDFLIRMQEQQTEFYNLNFEKMDLEQLTEKDFVYADPPYLITCATYNEQGGWTEKDERKLLAVLDRLSERNVKFALSNVIEAKGRRNEILTEWVKNRPDYRMIELDYTYRNANYQRQNRELVTREVLIINY